jgi:hypothetical protein
VLAGGFADQIAGHVSAKPSYIRSFEAVEALRKICLFYLWQLHHVGDFSGTGHKTSSCGLRAHNLAKIILPNVRTRNAEQTIVANEPGVEQQCGKVSAKLRFHW